MTDTSRGEGSKRKWADPQVRQRIIDGQRRYWEEFRANPELQKKRSRAAKKALADPEVRRRISEGTRKAYENPEVKKRLGEGLRRVWANDPGRHEQASITAKQVFGDPELEKRRREGFARPETREKISEAGQRTWKDNEKRRGQVSEWAKKLWDERRRAQAAYRPPRPRGRTKGQLSPDTEPRITMIASCRLQGMKDYQIALHAYPLYRRQADAWKAMEKFVKRHASHIAQRQRDLSNLSESERKTTVEVAMETLRS